MHNYEGDCQLTAFNNNTFEDFDLAPVYIYAANLKQLEKFDMTSDFTKNKKAYIELNRPDMGGNVTINQTTVPYYFDCNRALDINHILTINEGVTIYMNDDSFFIGYDGGRLMINGTAAKKVKITRLPGATYYWSHIDTGGETGGLSGSVIKHCIFEYGGLYSFMGVIFVTGGTNITFENVEFKNSKTYDAVVPTNNCDYNINHSNITYSRSSANVYLYGGTYHLEGCENEHPVILDEFPPY